MNHVEEDRTQESRVRRFAHRLGYAVRKSRRQTHAHNHGQFMLVNDHNIVILGADFDATLDHIEEYLNDRR